MSSYTKGVIVSKKNINISNRIDPEFYDEEITELEKSLETIEHFNLNDLVKLRGKKGDSKRRVNPSAEPKKSFFYIDISNTSKKDGTIFPKEINGGDASPRARKIVKKDNIILSTVRPNKNAVAIIYPEHTDYICSTGFALIEAEKINPKLLFIFFKTEYAISQLVRRTRSTMYPAVNPDVDVPQLIVPKCIRNVEKEVVDLVNQSTRYLQSWSMKLKEIDKRVIEKYNINSFKLPEFYEKPTIINREKMMNLGNRCDSEFFDSFFDYLYNFLGDNPINLSEITEEFFTGKTPASKEYSDDKNEPAIIKVGTLSNKGINWDDVEFIPESFLKSNKKYIIKENDILLTSSAHSREHIAKKIDVINGIPDEYNNRCITVGELMTIRLKDSKKIDPYLIASILRTPIGNLQIQRCIRGITSHIYPNDLLKFIKIPNIDDEFMTEISELVRDSENQRNYGRELFYKAKTILVEEIEKNLKLSDGVPKMNEL